MAIRSILTPKQKETLEFIRYFTVEYGYSPLITELQKHFKLNSLRSVTQRLDALEKKGLIFRNKFKHRGISLINKDGFSKASFMQVPVVASVGCDQQEIFAQEEFGQYLIVEQTVIGRHKDIIAFKATGNSMADAGIHNGDYVLVEPTPYAENGDRVVAIVGEMALLKRFQKAGNNIVLYPEATGYQPIVLNENFKIFGKFICTIPTSKETSDDFRIETIY